MEHDPRLVHPVIAVVSAGLTTVLATLAGVVATPAAAGVTFLVVVAATYAGFAVANVALGAETHATSNASHAALASILAVAVVVARVARGSTSAEPVAVGTTVVVTAVGAFAVLKLVADCQTAYRALSS